MVCFIMLSSHLHPNIYRYINNGLYEFRPIAYLPHVYARVNSYRPANITLVLFFVFPSRASTKNRYQSVRRKCNNDKERKESKNLAAQLLPRTPHIPRRMLVREGDVGEINVLTSVRYELYQ